MGVCLIIILSYIYFVEWLLYLAFAGTYDMIEIHSIVIDFLIATLIVRICTKTS